MKTRKELIEMVYQVSEGKIDPVDLVIEMSDYISELEYEKSVLENKILIKEIHNKKK